MRFAVILFPLVQYAVGDICDVFLSHACTLNRVSGVPEPEGLSAEAANRVVVGIFRTALGYPGNSEAAMDLLAFSIRSDTLALFAEMHPEDFASYQALVSHAESEPSMENGLRLSLINILLSKAYPFKIGRGNSGLYEALEIIHHNRMTWRPDTMLDSLKMIAAFVFASGSSDAVPHILVPSILLAMTGAMSDDSAFRVSMDSLLDALVTVSGRLADDNVIADAQRIMHVGVTQVIAFNFRPPATWTPRLYSMHAQMKLLAAGQSLPAVKRVGSPPQSPAPKPSMTRRMADIARRLIPGF